jgi:hypothetical protein
MMDRVETTRHNGGWDGLDRAESKGEASNFGNVVLDF